MEPSNKHSISMFDQFDEYDLALILNQVARRMMILRAQTPDAVHWFKLIQKLCHYLNSSPILNEIEKEMIRNPPEFVNGKLQAIKSLRARTGMKLQACNLVVQKWIEQNNIFYKSTN